jgi:hypothetical protein
LERHLNSVKWSARPNGAVLLLGWPLLMVMALFPAGFAQPPAPPSSLVGLEMKVSLKIAHVRIKGPTNAADLKQLAEAERIAAQGEKAMAAGDYRGAEQDFLRANVLITGIGN